jgi:ABC-type multidrug transport system ATPase subunit
MGPSGAGKSTLLDLLACRKDEGLRHGSVTLNGYALPTRPAAQALLRRNLGYVLQGDAHWPHLTVRETVAFAAALRMHGTADAAVHAARVALVLGLLRLDEIADVRVGSRRQAITDGEMKRLSVAVEMASLPTLLFCDEPTTGLGNKARARALFLKERSQNVGML